LCATLLSPSLEGEHGAQNLQCFKFGAMK